MLMVLDMGNDDLLFNFIYGLSHWAWKEVLQREAKIVNDMIRVDRIDRRLC